MKSNQLNKQTDKVAVYNKAVKTAYFAVLKVAKQLLASVSHEELRYSLTREDRLANETGSIIHEFLTPLLYMRIECGLDGVYMMHYGIETFEQSNEYTDITAKFIRCLYRLTSKELSGINIEHSIQVDWLITNCSEMYEHVEDRNKHHRFELIKHRVTANQRKRLLNVA